MAALDVPIQAFGANAEINAKIEFDSMGGDVTISATSPLSGTYSFRSEMTKDANNDVLGQMVWNTVAYDGLIIHTLYKIESSPSATIIIVSGANLKIQLNTSRNLILNESVTGSQVLAVGTVYRIEGYGDGDTNHHGLRLYDSGGTLLEELSQSGLYSSGGLNTTITFGTIDKETGTDPNCAVRFDEVAAWSRKANSGVNLFWPGATFVNHDTVDGAGTYNDYTGVGDVTNKWDNVNEWDTDTTYNQGGLLNVNKQQSHAVKDVTVLSGSQVMKGCMMGGLFKGSVSSTAAIPQTANMLIRESSTDYTTSARVGSSLSYVTRLMPFYTMPSGAVMTEAALNALEVGSENTGTNTTSWAGSTSGQSNPTGDDGTDDGAWTVSSGSASAYTTVDENIASADTTDYINTATADAKQGFSFSAYTVPSETYIAGMVVGVSWATSTFFNDSTAKLFYKDPGGTYNYGDSMSEILGTATVFTKAWATNPYTATDWVAGDINATDARFGIQKINTQDGKAYALQVRPLLISQYRESYYFINRIYGDRPVEIPNNFRNSLFVKQAINRSNTY